MSCLGDPSLHLTYPLREGQLGPTSASERFTIPNKGNVHLRAEVDHHSLLFLFSTNGSTWTKLPVNLDYSIISDEAGKGDSPSFTGAFVGMCCQDLTGQQCVADFNYFEYIEKT
jgi:xylan 1,4-beta-xylosidase